MMRLHGPYFAALAISCLCARWAVAALTLDTASTDSIAAAASQVAWTMLKNGYTGNNTGDVPGNLPDPYYWWQCGGMMTSLIDYWYYTGDTTYNDLVKTAIQWQAGDPATFMPANQSRAEGNDDQSFWGFAAMAAAETNFPNPADGEAQWLEMAQGVFNQQANRWDTTSCGGGLKWQIYFTNAGYNYKNAVSNGAFFNLASRLAVYSGNDTFAQWAEKTWNWVEAIGMISSDYAVYDGTNDLLNCTEFDHMRWSYNAGIYLAGAANMYKYTNNSAVWLERVNGLLASTISYFFSDGVMYEVACENFAGTKNYCNNDQLSFKSYLARWLIMTSKLVPSTSDKIMALIRSSAAAAALQCSGGSGNTANMCGSRWTSGAAHDGSDFDVGQQMSALQIIGGLLGPSAAALVTNGTGGTSTGDATAGSTQDDTLYYTPVVTTAGRAGAGILTFLIIVATLGGFFLMVS